MPAERTPPPDDSLLSRPLRAATRLLLRLPLVVVLLAVLTALASVVVAWRGLGYHTSRLDLLNPKDSYNQRWLAYLDEFGERDDVVVVVQGDQPAQVAAALDQVAAAVALESDLFQSVLHAVDLSGVRDKGLHYLPLEQLQRVEEFLYQYQPVLRGDWTALDVSRLIGADCERLALAGSPRLHATAAESRLSAAAELSGITRTLAAALQPEPAYQSPWPETETDANPAAAGETQHLLAKDGRMGFVLLRIRSADDPFARGSQALDRLRELVRRQRDLHPEVSIGVTGLPVMENDEMRASKTDMVTAGVVSLLATVVLFMAGFGSLRYPLMTVAALILAMAWSLAYSTFAVGHLNILSVAFGAILIGLGIDFGIHYIARYLQLRAANKTCEEALLETSGGIGPGIITGGLTTAIAFFTTLMTDFTGVAELGVIAGGGIVLCVMAALSVLPAMIYLSDRRRHATLVPNPLPLGRMQWPASRLPACTVVAGLLVTAGIAMGASQLRYDHNLLNLQPVGLESVDLERELLHQSDQSIWYAVSMAESREELLRLKQRYEKLDSVERTETIISLLPAPNPNKVAIIRRIAGQLQQLPSQPPLIPPAPAETLQWQLQRAAALLRLTGDPFAAASQQLEALVGQLRSMPEAERSRRIAQLQQYLAGDLLARLCQLRASASPEPPDSQDLPPGLVSRFVGKRQRQLLKIFARGNIWNMEALHRFVSDVESIDPRVTGHPVQTYYASRQMQQSYVHAAVYSFLAVAAVLMLDFRSISHSLLAMLPIALGMLQLFGLLGLLDLPLNPANMIVLPLILGIGIDDGVHVMHDFRRQQGPYRLANSTATAVVLTSATTMVGFGSLMLAKHQGLRSLGQVLTLGVFCCLMSSLLVLPALLAWVSRLRRRATPTPLPSSTLKPLVLPLASSELQRPRRTPSDHADTSAGRRAA